LYSGKTPWNKTVSLGIKYNVDVLLMRSGVILISPDQCQTAAYAVMKTENPE
jgi:hypothetical protein